MDRPQDQADPPVDAQEGADEPSDRAVPERVEKAQPSQINPLAPPINNQGSG